MVNERQIPKNISKENIKKQTQNPKNKKNRKKQADDKSAHLKKQKTVRKLLRWTILIGIFVGIIVFLCKAKMFKICNIEVTGNSQISQEIILLLSEIKLQDNIFLANTIRAKNKISENPYIEDITVKRVLPDKIKIEVKEKEKLYMIKVAQNYAYIDKNGDILEISKVKLDNLITLQEYLTPESEIEPGNRLTEKDLERIEDVQTILKSAEKNEINDKIASINIKDKNDYILYVPTYKKIIYVGDTSNLATKMLRTKDILDKTIGKEGKIFVNGNFSKGFDPYFREEKNN